MKIPEKARLDITAELFKAIGHPMRLALLETLQKGPACVCDLATQMNIGKSVASKHLSLLYDIGLLEMEKKGTQVIYTLVAPCVIEMGQCSFLAVMSQKNKRLGRT
jgi:ArsR family transcriptional regulator